MTSYSRTALLGLLTCLILSAPALAGIPFDNTKYMPVAEVRDGMTGYGLSVFSGNKIERFEVEVVSVLRNFNPRGDVILIRFSGAGLEHTGAIEGMSGSPIYLKDDQGNFRMIGAFAYGWRAAKDPIAGVQPIEYMLKINNPSATQPASTQPATTTSASNTAASPVTSTDIALSRAGQSAARLDSGTSSIPMQWTYQQVLESAGLGSGKPSSLASSRSTQLPGMNSVRVPLAAGGLSALLGENGSLSDPYAELRPLATPLSVSGQLASSLLTHRGNWHGSDDTFSLQQAGTTQLQSTSGQQPVSPMDTLPPAASGVAGSDAASSSGPASQPATAPAIAGPAFAPGSAIAVPLLTGDVDLTAIGTVTEVSGNQVLAFGHSFNSEGVVTLPMATARINGVVSGLLSSFKLGETDRVVGALRADEMVGVAGHVGPAPAMMPIDLSVEYTDGQPRQSYHFNAAIHHMFTAELGAMAAQVALTGQHELPEEASIEYDLSVAYANGRVVHIRNSAAGTSGREPVRDLQIALSAAMDNPFQRVLPSSIKGTIRVIPESRRATILSINAPRIEFQPGQTVKAYLTYRPYRQPESVMPVEFVLPADLPEGQYSLSISDADSYLNDEQHVAPYRFVAENADDLLDMVQDILSVPSNALYIRLVQQSDGLAIGRTAMPRLPGTRRQIMLESGRSNVTPLMSSVVRSVPTALQMSGQVELSIKVDKMARVQVGQHAHEQPGSGPEHIAPDRNAPEPHRADQPAPSATE